MEPYKLMTRLLSDLTKNNDWPTFQKLLRRAVSKKPRHWRLPVLGCQAVGGKIQQAIPAMAGMACLQISILLIDDLLDDDARGIHHHIGLAEAANLALAFYSTGLKAVCLADVPQNIVPLVFNKLILMMATIAYGQYLDVQGAETETDYWRIVRTKSSPFFGAALYTGALMGGALVDVGAQLERLGCLYGEMIQIHDDLNDSMATPANSDWTSGRSPLPILFAQTVDHPQRARFLELRASITEPEALSEAQTILIRCGAVSYCIDQLLHRYHAAKQFLDAIPLPFPGELEKLLVASIQPVEKLLAASGICLSNVLPCDPGRI